MTDSAEHRNLTAAELDALLSAIAYGDAELENHENETGDRSGAAAASRERKALDRARQKILNATPMAVLEATRRRQG